MAYKRKLKHICSKCGVEGHKEVRCTFPQRRVKGAKDRNASEKVDVDQLVADEMDKTSEEEINTGDFLIFQWD